MLSWLVTVSSLFVIILLFYTLKYIVTLIQLEPSEFTQNNQITVNFKESIFKKFRADTHVIVKCKEDVYKETQLDIHCKNECPILHHSKDLNFPVFHS